MVENEDRTKYKDPVQLFKRTYAFGIDTYCCHTVFRFQRVTSVSYNPKILRGLDGPEGDVTL